MSNNQNPNERPSQNPYDKENPDRQNPNDQSNKNRQDKDRGKGRDNDM